MCSSEQGKTKHALVCLHTHTNVDTRKHKHKGSSDGMQTRSWWQLQAKH